MSSSSSSTQYSKTISREQRRAIQSTRRAVRNLQGDRELQRGYRFVRRIAKH